MNLDVRDRLVDAFRRYLFTQLKVYPFKHQAAWMLATAGLQLTGRAAHPQATRRYIDVRLRDKSVHRLGVTERPGGRATVSVLMATSRPPCWKGSFRGPPIDDVVLHHADELVGYVVTFKQGPALAVNEDRRLGVLSAPR